MARSHHYRVTVEWTGNRGAGTSRYEAYSRDHEIRFGSKPAIAGSSAPEYRGDASRYNPEELLVAALSACHMLWYLHLCANRGIEVTAYEDEAEGELEVGPNGAGRFREVLLRPRVVLARGDAAAALALHGEANAMCFIANSVNFPVRHEPSIVESAARG